MGDSTKLSLILAVVVIVLAVVGWFTIPFDSPQYSPMIAAGGVVIPGVIFDFYLCPECLQKCTDKYQPLHNGLGPTFCANSICSDICGTGWVR